MIGLIGKKIGMSAVFDAVGRHTPVTVIKAGPCPVVQRKTVETDGYNAVQLGFEQAEKNVTKPEKGHFNKSKVQPHRILSEIRDFSGDPAVGENLKVDLFNPGDKVEVSGISKGRGFAGVIKRHGFHRPNQTHGTHEAFRAGGSVGQASFPARVFPGMRMPGRLGGSRVTVKNLKVVRVDLENGIILVKGAVPGAAGGYLVIRKRG